MENYYHNVDCCPVCKLRQSSFHSYSKPNLYSEKIAYFLGIEEAELLNTHYNLECEHCGLIYKNKWFNKEGLIKLFTDLVPSHPKGWDAFSHRFSFKNLYFELNEFKVALQDQNDGLISRYKRALVSILDSSEVLVKHPRFQELCDAIEKAELAVFSEHEVKELLKNSLITPAPYKRFAGFNDLNLWNYLQKKTAGGLNQYDELGCPLWGLMRTSKASGADTRFIMRPEENYWADGCVDGELHCSVHLQNEKNVSLISWDESNGEKRQLIGFFQYLDHLNDPLSFLDEIFNRYSAAAIILDKAGDTVYVQHFTGFTDKTMKYLADKYQKNLHTDFEEILPSGNVLYLLN